MSETTVNTDWIACSENYFNLVCLHPQVREEASACVRVAMGYVWGREDALGEQPWGEHAALHFGYHYGIIAAMFEAGKSCFKPSIVDAFRQWESDIQAKGI